MNPVALFFIVLGLSLGVMALSLFLSQFDHYLEEEHHGL